MRFSYRMVPEVYQLFWAAMARGSSSPMPLSGWHVSQAVHPVVVAAGGVRPRRGRGLKGRCLRFG
jgi:hypothetical protein